MPRIAPLMLLSLGASLDIPQFTRDGAARTRADDVPRYDPETCFAKAGVAGYISASREYFRRADSCEDGSRRRCSRDVDIPWTRVAATPRLRRGYSVETTRTPRYWIKPPRRPSARYAWAPRAEHARDRCLHRKGHGVTIEVPSATEVRKTLRNHTVVVVGDSFGLQTFVSLAALLVCGGDDGNALPAGAKFADRSKYHVSLPEYGTTVQYVNNNFGVAATETADKSRDAWYFRRADISQRGRGGAAGGTWIFRGDESRRRRGCIGRVAATPRRATRIFRGDESRRRRGRDVVETRLRYMRDGKKQAMRRQGRKHLVWPYGRGDEAPRAPQHVQDALEERATRAGAADAAATADGRRRRDRRRDVPGTASASGSPTRSSTAIGSPKTVRTSSSSTTRASA